jgi:glyoxylase I family protein
VAWRVRWQPPNEGDANAIKVFADLFQRRYGSAVENLTCTGVSHLELYVSDLEASVAWYGSTMGFRPMRGEPGRYAVLQPASGGFRLVLRPDRPADAHGEFGHVAFSVASLADLEAWAEQLDQAGVTHKGIKEGPTGYTIDLVDPDGYDLELTYEA